MALKRRGQNLSSCSMGRPRSTGLAATRLLVAMSLVGSLAAAALLVNHTRRPPNQAGVVSVEHVSRPLRILLVGDSMAGTLGVGLAKAAPASGITLIDAALGGCAVADAWDSGAPVDITVPVRPGPPCQNATQLAAYWEHLLRLYRPQVVIYVSRVDTIPEQINSGSTRKLASLLDASFQAYFLAAMTQAIGVLSSTGAHVILTTSAPTKMDDPRRWTIYDSIVESVAARSLGRATVFDLGRFFEGNAADPIFKPRSPSGIDWRCTDGIHFTEAGGALVAPSLFGLAWRIWTPQDTSGDPAVPPSVANQPWAPFAAHAAVIGCRA
jgi:SGNH domain (fused to AT3 domains)